LSLDERIDLLYESFNLIQNKGLIIIHEVKVLPKLEKDFLMWDSYDFELIMSKINPKINKGCAKTDTRPDGWPLHTIALECKGVKRITKEEIHSAIIASLEEIKKHWLNYETSEEFINIKDLEMKNRFKAFYMAQNYNVDLWINKYNRRKQEGEFIHEDKFVQNKNDNIVAPNLKEQNPKLLAKFKRLKREITEYSQLVEHDFLSEYDITYNDLEDIEKLPIMVEMLSDIIIKNENLRMHGYSSDLRRKSLKELYDFFSSRI